ncbi:MAG: hypothetical protein KDB95_15410, partial [Flavobacteriales bacterium]|nr:hypothetical protein [Flavobacteriales bacterium]
MDLKRRLQLYLIGLIIGGFVAYFFYGDRLTNAAWTPEEKIKQRMRSTLLKSTPEAEQQLAAWSIQLSDVRASIAEASVHVRDTKRAGDSLYYT